MLLNGFGHRFDSIPRETVGRKSTHIFREIPPKITDIQAVKPVITPNYQRLNDYWEQKYSKPKQKPYVIPSGESLLKINLTITTEHRYQE